MAALNDIRKSFFSLFVSRTVRPSTGQYEPRTAPSASANGDDEERMFLASVAHLPAEEQQKRIQKRLWYTRLAQRQAIMEHEYLAERYRSTDER